MSLELVIAAAMIAGTPLLLAALGELLSERAGVINLGLEGTMLVGAVAGFAAATVAGNVWAGVAVAALAGGLFGLLLAFLVITLRMNQIVTGLAFTILGGGLSAYLGKPFVGKPLADQMAKPDLGPLADLPFLGPALFRHDMLVYLAVVLAVLTAIYLRRTRYGLILRAVGESPDVLDTLGMNVTLLRYAYVAGGAALAGLGGAYLSLVYTPSWIENMTAGRGWIALALVIFASWRPLWLLTGAYLFGLVDALRFRMQLVGAEWISPYFLSMLPYLATILVLVLVSRGKSRVALGAPAALGIAYDRERR
jgi:simple sugar transport system permease protein